MVTAITRKVSPAIAQCELTHLRRSPIDVALAERQHAAYERCLESLGCRVHRLPLEAALPDSVFVEDAAVVFPELAIITRPGAESRRPETATMADALRPYRSLRFITAPATLDGGDVLLAGARVFVGLSCRTNPAAIGQMRSLLTPYGYSVQAVPVTHCLHLKSAASLVCENTLLVNPGWVPAGEVFGGLDLIAVASQEVWAANALRIGNTVVFPAAFPETRKRLEGRGITVRALDISELSKAEGAVTCCSVIID